MCLRNDKEKGKNVVSKDRIISILRMKNKTFFSQDTAIDFNLKDIKKRKIELNVIWEKFANSKLVITDRLHGMIFSVITETPCIVFDNIDGKVGHLGINGLFGDVLGLLSMADLGFGTAMVYSFYKPLAEKDYKKMAGLTTFYKKVYGLIAIVVSILGIAVIPFLPKIIKLDKEIPHLVLYYILSLGKEYLLSNLVVVAISANMYLSCVLQPLWSYREATGLYNKTKWAMVACAILNLILSIVMGKRIGLAGVLFASGISRLCTYVWYEPRLLFKEYFGRKVGKYYKQLLTNTIFIVCLIGILGKVSGYIIVDSILKWFVKACTGEDKHLLYTLR